MTIRHAWAVSQFHAFALSTVLALGGPLGAIFNTISCSLCQYAALSKLALTSSKSLYEKLSNRNVAHVLERH